ncbi:MAG: tetratricopeptide repeat protein [Anaerosomatales bacterium]|nr:tetratricopeptide repeat protein [Anaerosomatales bacterium]MDT8433568.1 tetratricopeptide repeat protein [Anaerosomatales bacterium]
MDQARFEEGQAAYAAKDYRAAAKAFLAAADRGEGNGPAYHMAGNSLVRLRRFSDAVTVYRHAANDESYERRSAVQANLGAAHVALGEYAEAVRAYDVALEDPGYAGQFKALQGKAGALFEMGRIEEAATAYRQAALDGDNPDPGKALNNLGLCFMAMDRPTDAVEAYRAALGFDTYTGRGRALSNLGMAYHVIGRHEDAVRSFEKATELHGHELSETARVAYVTSAGQLRSPEQREIVEGWSTGEMPPVMISAGDTQGEREAKSKASPDATTSMPHPSGDEVDSFFRRTDEEMRERDRESRRSERQMRQSERNPWSAVIIVVLAVALVLGSTAALFAMGIGYPTQRMTVAGMLEARASGNPVARYWVAVPTSDVDKEMAKLPPMKEFSIDSVERSPRTSLVTVTVTPESGAPLSYGITLAREGVGWKVTGVENDWRSTGGGS